MDRHGEGPIQRDEGSLVLALYVDGSEAKPKAPRQVGCFRLE